MDAVLQKEILDLIKSMQQQDSIEVGTPAKGGSIKVYGNLETASKELEEKLLKGILIMKKANLEIKSE